MKAATEIRPGHVIKLDGIVSKVISLEIRGTGQFGKTIHLKLKRLTDGHLLERSLRAEDKVEEAEVHYVTLEYLYREKDRFAFMNTESFEQVFLPAQAIGKQEILLKENSEVKAIYLGEQPIAIDFPKTVELKVVSAPPGVRGQADTTFKEVELENGLKILAPQFIREGETVRVATDDFSYVDRVTTKSLKPGSEKKEP